ncbi:MAG TPA: transcriptional regulator [Candidatus Limnocylindrales bacterium]|nr:transcriptional regulator [Candidatus Limnocylindrales bacterium]
MRADIENYMSLDRIVHEPARLVILTLLAEADAMEFRFLEKVSGFTKGNLSGHISKLEQAGYVEVVKFFRGKLPATSLKITAQGRKALKQYRRQLNEAFRHKPTFLTAVKRRFHPMSS